MGSEWTLVSLGDNSLKIGSGATPRGGSSVYLDEGEISLIRSQNIHNDGFKVNGLVYITAEAAEKLKNVVVEENDILLNITGDSVARICMVDNNFLPARVNQHVSIIRPSPDSFDARYLRYQLVSPTMQNLLLTLASAGATRNALTKNMIETLKVSKPPLETQKAIAHILGSLDDKIELNRQMNETLEAMAQALFKSWFVDFDPVIDNALVAGNAIPDVFAERALRRSSGRSGTSSDDVSVHEKEKPHKSGGVSFNTHPSTLRRGSGRAGVCDDELSVRPEPVEGFPDAFEYTEEMGWIPEGWGVKQISDLVESVSITYPLKTVDEIIFLNTGDILDGKFIHNNYSDVTGLPGQAKKSIKKHDILYSEIRPKNKRYAYVNFDADDYVVSTKLMVLRSISEIKPLFSYFFLKQESTISYLQLMAESRSGTFPQITFDVLSKLSLVLPKESDLIDHFTNEFLEPFYNRINKNEIESESLSKLRDTLLPKLLSGELRIPDAEKLIEEAI